MKLTLDVENTTTKRDGKLHLDPFEPTNKLIMVGCLEDNGQQHLFNMDVPDGIYLQEVLDRATILIGHNIAYDLMWLWESGYKYDGAVFDTMLAEYIIQRGIKQPLSLEACAERYELETQKKDTLKHYFAQGVGVDGIPRDELKEYLSADLKATQQLSDKLYKKLNTVEYAKLMDSVILTNKVSVCLAKIYKNGFSVDKNKLTEVKQEFEQEKNQIEGRLKEQVVQLMGDTPINLSSPEQMSWVIYSRKPKDKVMWANSFTPYMSEKDYKQTIKENSDVVYKTTAIQCDTCDGVGKIRKVRKNGIPYANPNNCGDCNSNGYKFKPTNSIAGLKFTPPNAKWVSANGFTVNKTNLVILQNIAKKNDLTNAVQFLEDLQRLSALETYLSSFVDGINTYTKPDGKLHVRLLQHRTATG